jgi:ADP-heptose:LPS heptosyltransferase
MKVLLINLARMGDLVQITPVALGLKVERNAVVSVLVPRQYAAFAKRLEGVDEVLPYPDDAEEKSQIRSAEELVESLRKRQFDLVVNLTHEDASTQLAESIRGRRTLGRSGPLGAVAVSGSWFRYFYSVLNHRTLNPFNLCDIYRHGAGIRRSAEVRMKPNSGDAKAVRDIIGELGGSELVMIHPGANHPHRRWPTKNYGSLMERLAGAGLDVRVIYGPGEENLADEVVRASSGYAKKIPDPIGMELLPALLAEADLLVTNDTGPLHIAASVGTPTVSIFLAMARPQDTAPYAPGHMVLETLHDSHPSSEHAEGDVSPCAWTVPVDAVVECAIARLTGTIPDNAVLHSLKGQYRVLLTVRDEHGDHTLNELYASKKHTLDRASDLLKPVWRRMLGNYERGQESSGAICETLFNKPQVDAMLSAIKIAHKLADRIAGEPVFDESGNSLTISQLEASWVELEMSAEDAAAILLPFRLEREALYSRGLEQLQQQYDKRMKRWLSAVTAAVGERAKEAVS